VTSPVDALGRLAAAQPLGALLDADLLGVDELRLVEVDAERPLSLTALALVGLLKLAVLLGDVVHRPTALALESRVGDLRPHVGRLADDPLHRDELPDVVVVDADAADVDVLGQVPQPDVGVAEFDIRGQVVEPERLLGVLLELVGLGTVVLGEIRIELVEVVVIDIQRPLFVGILLGELSDRIAVVVAIELDEPVGEFLIGGLRH